MLIVCQYFYAQNNKTNQLV